MSMEDDAELRKQSFYNHPKLHELGSSGIKSKEIIEHALLVYLHLIEVQFWFDVDMIPVVDKQIILLKGRRKNNVELFEYVLPMSSNSVFKTVDIHAFIDCACKNGCLDESILIAFVDTSAMVIYYKISKGLVPPRKPSNKEIMKMNRIPEWNDKKGKWRTCVK